MLAGAPAPCSCHIEAFGGHYRDFESQRYKVKIDKGQENADVLRKAAKDLDHTQAAEIVNADSLVDVIGPGLERSLYRGEAHAGSGPSRLRARPRDVLIRFLQPRATANRTRRGRERGLWWDPSAFNAL